MPFADVKCLSDDEDDAGFEEANDACPSSGSAAGIVEKVVAKDPCPIRVPKKRGTKLRDMTPADHRRVIGLLVCKICPCRSTTDGRPCSGGNCLRQFKSSEQDLFQLRWKLRKLAKQDMDNEALPMFWQGQGLFSFNCLLNKKVSNLIADEICCRSFKSWEVFGKYTSLVVAG